MSTSGLSPHPSITHPDATKPQKLHLFGYPISHSVGPYVHTFVAEHLGVPWVCTHFETPDLEKVSKAIRAEDFFGGAVTMPMKLSIMEKLDGMDETSRIVGAVNTITSTQDGKRIGSNTEYVNFYPHTYAEHLYPLALDSAVGIRDALVEISHEGRGLPGLVLGAGGASRAAVFCLLSYLDCPVVYLVNRDSTKAHKLIEDMAAGGFKDAKKALVVESVGQAQELDAPFYAVGSVQFCLYWY
jgi:quinate dehydrogenase